MGHTGPFIDQQLSPQDVDKFEDMMRTDKKFAYMTAP